MGRGASGSGRFRVGEKVWRGRYNKVYNNQTPGKHPKEYIIDSKHGESLKSRILDTLNFIMSLFHASTCFEHMCSSSGGHNYRCDHTRGCIVQFWPPDDEHVCSKRVDSVNLCTGRPPIGVMIPDAV